ncbi:unnamed protein product [Toxocara canis]|uniref:Uncharacterized protein n=1 Tax=Toxocara canis TaxID=6265 RepID=A0A3P7GIC2_TOXCA|nr:unnamed protein product [Toxocara canis]
MAAAGQTKSKYSIKEKQPGGAPFDQPSFVGLSCAYNNSLRESLRRFIESFHNGSLSRHRLSEERLPPQLTASGQAHYDGLRTENRIDATTAQRFSTDLLNASSSQDIVLLLSGGAWHGPSAAVFYVYHTVAYYFRPFEAMIKFFLVDISKNELPWQFKVDRLPALLFFPAKRRSASSVLPRSWPLTVPSVVAFVLARCQPELRWHIALSSCSGRCVRRNVLMLRQHAHQLSNEIAALRHLTTVLQLRATHARLVGTLILRRAAQLRVCRKALRVVQSLWLPSSVRLSERVAELSRESQIIRALFESSIPAHIRGGA